MFRIFSPNIIWIDDGTAYTYLHQYEELGLSAYLETHYKGYWGQLSSMALSALRQELNTTLYTDSKLIIAWIEKTFGKRIAYQESIHYCIVSDLAIFRPNPFPAKRIPKRKLSLGRKF
jgi:hypothetical protein